jgi:hypothetical protein
MKFTMIFIFCITATITGFTQSKKEAIKELFVVLHLDSTTKVTYKTMSNTMIDQLSNSYSTLLGDSAKKSQFLAITQRYYNATLENSRLVVEQILPGLYEKYYTEDEIKELTAFYKTKTGQKYILSQPGIINELTNNSLVMTKAKETSARLIQEIQELFSNN